MPRPHTPLENAPSLAWRQWLTEPRWPRQCELCRTWSRQSFCHECVTRLAAPQLRCAGCALPSPNAGLCGACLRDPPCFDTAVAAVDYGFPWDGVISRFKYHQQVELSSGLARLLVHAIERSAHEPMPQLVIPMPLSPTRLRERGFNQAWELTRSLSRTMGIAASPEALGRLRDTPHQVGLGRRQRESNLRNALWVAPEHATLLKGRRVALVDDVMTTGASANAAAHALKAAGAARVMVWVVARTPRPEDRR